MRVPPGIARLLYSVLPGFALLWLVYSCATIVTPSGGEKDVTPPKLLRSDPRNKSTHFKGNRIVLSFNEYIQLKEMDKNLLVSPPLLSTPDMKIKGRSLIIKLKDTLRNNTTYSFYFGNAIVDLTEANPLKNYSLAFSTGDAIDSLSISGKVSDAFTRMPVKDVLVMLYTDMADSAPMLQRPVYVSRTGDGGVFTLSSLAAGKYRMVTLKDGDNSYTYNLPNEQVGFYDSLVEPSYIAPPVNDTVMIASADQKQYGLDIFSEPDSIQRLSKGSMVAPHQLLLAFRFPTSNPRLVPLNMDSTSLWSVREVSPNHDSITCWLAGTVPDSLHLKISDAGIVIDTLEVSTLYKLKTSGRKNQVADTSLKFQTVSSRTGFLGWNTDYTLTFANPLASYNSDLPRLIIGGSPDTLKPVIEFTDSIRRRMKIKYAWKTLEDYTLLLPLGTFRDIYGQVNDSSRFAFKLKPRDEYGTFKVNVKLVNVNHPMIIQLLSEKGNVLQQQIIHKSQAVDFGFLPPAKYGLKAIYDWNGNGRWDTGQFMKKKQPERIAMHPKVFEVRGNWDLEEEWEL